MAEELTEEEHQLLWKYATEDVTTEELAQIEELQSTSEAFSRELQELEAQKRDEAERRRKSEEKKGGGALLWIAVVILIAALAWFILR